jgi:hypothetical protein
MADIEQIPDFDNGLAEVEGWGIFDCQGSESGAFKLCRDDATEIFENDDQAWDFVVARALEGSGYHIAALRYIKRHSPEEWENLSRVHRIDIGEL